MSDRHDLRRQTREIREALSRFEPEQLVDILTHIFRQYVMDGATAPASSVSLQDELQGLSFAQLIERLQLRLDLPELRLLEVTGSRVMARVEGRLVPIEVPDTRAPDPLPLPVTRVNNIQQIQITAQPVSTATSSAPSSPPPSVGTQSQEMPSAVPGVRPVGHSGSGRPDGTASQTAPRPGGATARSAAPAAGPTARPAGPAAGAAAAPAPARPEKPAPPEKPVDNGGRFNLLEID